ncbi:MAG: carbamoyl-phosphate synthase large chain, partial [archaeon]
GAPNIVYMILNGRIRLVINTPTKGGLAKRDGYKIRRACIQKKVPCITTIAGAKATLGAIRRKQEKEFGVKSLQQYYQEQN